VISIIEEAQFLGLNVRFWRDAETDEIIMGISSTPDGSFPIDLCDQNAHHLLEAIGMGQASSGSMLISDLNDLINDPPTRRHLAWKGMETCLEQLDRMARACSSSDPQLVWH
jgi:hypothetical protein